MVFRITPSLGPQLDEAFPAEGAYWDNQLAIGYPAATLEPSYKLGSVVRGNDGGEYFYVKASAAISATATTGTQVTLTFPGYTIATGAGGFYTTPNLAVPINGYIHVRRGAYNATPA